MLSLESASQLTISQECDDKIIDNIILLRLTITRTYSMLVHSNIDALSNRLPPLLTFLDLVWRDTEFRTPDQVKQIILLIRYVN